MHPILCRPPWILSAGILERICASCSSTSQRHRLNKNVRIFQRCLDYLLWLSLFYHFFECIHIISFVRLAGELPAALIQNRVQVFIGRVLWKCLKSRFIVKESENLDLPWKTAHLLATRREAHAFRSCWQLLLLRNQSRYPETGRSSSREALHLRTN